MLDTDLIASLPPFEGMARTDLEALLQQARPRYFAKGDHVFRQGGDAEYFFALLDGHIRVVKITPTGEQVIARYISSGELFGIATAIGRTVYPANAIAAVDCVALAWPSSIWPATVERYPSFAINTYHTIGERLQEAQDRIVEMATERVEQRVAAAILKLANQTGKQTEDGLQIDFPISRQDLSEMTGTTLHTVSRLVSAWETSGYIKSGRRKIIVIKSDELKLVVNGEKATRTSQTR
ncbi:helix-turn-helix domain-containing protein [Alphaproteobacteria bacterium HT1-32]|nr:helix-turn-helix domain-containing protein [Alphaproteobacteria bacterium HT1-32]